MARSEALKAAQKKYAEKVRQIKLTFLTDADGDILERLDAAESKVEYIRALIRADIKKSGD